mmetsp:Transcript_6199/g.14129  ORF Transcript_6199/g.14129 Transcript_6199/m.14129 type:complete len:82 (-) Transcript_6199:91-336(-)
MIARSIGPAMVFSTEELAHQTDIIAQAEGAVFMMINSAIGCNAVFFSLSLLSGLFNLRKHLRLKAAVQDAAGKPKPSVIGL